MIPAKFIPIFAQPDDDRLVCATKAASNARHTPNRLPKQDIQRATTDLQCLRRMAVGEASLRLGLPGIAGVVKQYGLPMMLEGFFQLDSGFPVKGLRRQEGLLGNGCIGVGHGVALLGCQQNAMYWEMGGLYATEQTTPLPAT